MQQLLSTGHAREKAFLTFPEVWLEYYVPKSTLERWRLKQSPELGRKLSACDDHGEIRYSRADLERIMEIGNESEKGVIEEGVSWPSSRELRGNHRFTLQTLMRWHYGGCPHLNGDILIARRLKVKRGRRGYRHEWFFNPTQISQIETARGAALPADWPGYKEVREEFGYSRTRLDRWRATANDHSVRHGCVYLEDSRPLTSKKLPRLVYAKENSDAVWKCRIVAHRVFYKPDLEAIQKTIAYLRGPEKPYISARDAFGKWQVPDYCLHHWASKAGCIYLGGERLLNRPVAVGKRGKRLYCVEQLEKIMPLWKQGGDEPYHDQEGEWLPLAAVIAKAAITKQTLCEQQLASFRARKTLALDRPLRAKQINRPTKRNSRGGNVWVYHAKDVAAILVWQRGESVAASTASVHIASATTVTVGSTNTLRIHEAGQVETNDPAIPPGTPPGLNGRTSNGESLPRVMVAGQEAHIREQNRFDVVAAVEEVAGRTLAPTSTVLVAEPDSLSVKPIWDADNKLLSFGDWTKQYVRPAQQQFLVLESFQEQGWPEQIDAPVRPDKIKDVVGSLQVTFQEGPIQFGRVGGERITWSLRSN